MVVAPIIEQRRFYIASRDYKTNTGNFQFANADECLVAGRMAGTHEVPVANTSRKTKVGLPPLVRQPRLIIGADGDDALDIYSGDAHFVSSRARDILLALDKDAFEFAECETLNGRGCVLESYWMMAVVRVVQTFDEQASSFVTYAQAFADDPQSAGNDNIVQLNDIHWDASLASDFHAFYLTRYRRDYIVDEDYVRAWNDAKLSGQIFSPLQEPSSFEAASLLDFVNFEFWSKQSLA